MNGEVDHFVVASDERGEFCREIVRCAHQPALEQRRSLELGRMQCVDRRDACCPKCAVRLRACYPQCRQQLQEAVPMVWRDRSEEHTSELQSREKLVCRLLLEKKKTIKY